ncbi:hypothetical protein BABINDRAFT_160888 [Babjeviella inositovora NRRL Y-12698]|uniref:EamA domain-containing protein n=1 Tax=Babjeviella inositovora NRRL Y-12698 TaxID=984486 RepID=A0A1E3QSE9_9ASCO|nr:uncharacterized protein BABINDRAFT_160888 [Babjeviella inositovora NRRL Y-12698]ODQ80636.1 hypothetical protein BABINDRAFT_160888 [Babjeviella inositovora NRRL Y-12698]
MSSATGASPKHASYTPLQIPHLRYRSSPSILAVGVNEIVLGPPDRVADIIEHEERKRWKLGLYLIAMAVVTWVLCTELMNVVLKGNEYHCAFLMSYILGSCFSLYLLPEMWLKFRSQPLGSECEPLLPDEASDSSELYTTTKELGHRETIILATEVGFIYFFYNVFVASSLKYTNASDQTILSTTSSIFTLLMGVWANVEKFTLFKLLSLVVSFVGIILINIKANGGQISLVVYFLTMDDTYKPKNPLLGNCFAIMASVMYSLYLVLLKVRIGNDVTVNERHVFGLVGVATLLTCWPLIILAHYTGFETFALPPSTTVWLMLGVNGVFLVISDYCVALAMLLTSPVITSLSLTTAIPLTMICDSVFFGVANGGMLYYLGICLIFSSFVLINVSSRDEMVEVALDTAIGSAITRDGHLTPLLSPLLSSSPRSYAHSPSYTPKTAKTPVLSRFRNVVSASDAEADLPLALPLLLRNDMGYFDLNHDVEGSIDNLLELPDNGAIQERGEYPQILVRGGMNHKYTIKDVGDHDV